MNQNAEVIELSLERTIETKLVQANVTNMVLASLKEKYGNMKLKALDDKESYLEIKAAAKDCAKVRTLAVKICKEGREEAVRTQKLWIAKEKEVVSQVAEVEDALDSEINRFDNEVKRLEQEEKNRQEESYINRQAMLTKMGAVYADGSFILGETSFEANLIKGSSEEVWLDSVLPKFQDEYKKIEAVRIAEQKKKYEEEVAMKAQQEKLCAEQEAFRLQQEEFAHKQEEAARLEREKLAAEQREKEKIEREAEYERMRVAAEAAAEEKRLADIEKAKQEAILAEQKRQADAEEAKKQEELRKQSEIEAANDKTKWDEFIKEVKGIKTFDMRSGQYRKKMQIAKGKIDEIISL